MNLSDVVTRNISPYTECFPHKQNKVFIILFVNTIKRHIVVAKAKKYSM